MTPVAATVPVMTPLAATVPVMTLVAATVPVMTQRAATVPVMTLAAATVPVAKTSKLWERRRKLGFMAHYELLSRRMRCAGHVARMGRGEAYTGFWWENLRERDHLGDPGVEETIILRLIFRMWDVGAWTGLIWLRIETVGGHL